MPGRYQSVRQVRMILAGAAAIVVLSLALLIYFTRGAAPSTLPERLLADLLYPFQRSADWLVDGLKGGAQGVSELFHLRNDNRSLRAEVRELQGLRGENEQLKKETAGLRQQLNLPAGGHTVLAAEVIGRSPDNWFHTFVINRGSRNGVREDMPVINHQGMVGRVIKVGDFSAVVRLMSSDDPANKVGGLNSRSGQAGTVSGAGEKGLYMEFFARDAAVNVGDSIVTSGLGGLVPAGLPLGTVVEVGRHQNNLFPTATIKPLVDFERLDFVSVILTPVEDHLGEATGP